MARRREPKPAVTNTFLLQKIQAAQEEPPRLSWSDQTDKERVPVLAGKIAAYPHTGIVLSIVGLLSKINDVTRHEQTQTRDFFVRRLLSASAKHPPELLFSECKGRQMALLEAAALLLLPPTVKRLNKPLTKVQVEEILTRWKRTGESSPPLRVSRTRKNENGSKAPRLSGRSNKTRSTRTR